MADGASTTDAAKTSPTRLPADRRHSQLLRVAAALVAETGAEQVTMEAVADQAGVSKALVYRHFDNAEALLLELAERELITAAGEIATTMRRAVTFEDSVRLALGAWFDVLTERGPLVISLLESPTLAGPLGERRRALRRSIGEHFSTLAAANYQLSPLQANVATTILLAGLEGVIDCWLDGRAPRWQLVDTYSTICLAGYRALAEEPPVIGA
jgi:AcrR family transcriptional regulator